MLQGLLFIGLFLLVVLLVIVLFVAHFVFKGLGAFRKMMGKTGFTADSAAFRPDSGRRQERSADTPTGETIIDSRNPNIASRQIISDDEGEYVDYIETK